VYLEAGLPSLQGVKSVSANPLTGNVLVHFDPHRDHADMARGIEEFTRQFRRTSGSVSPPTVAARRLQSAHLTDPVETGVTPWHCQDIEAVLQALHTSALAGLAEQDAAARLQQDGPNTLSATPPRSQFRIVVEQFTSLPVLLLGAAAGLSLVTGGLVVAVVILNVVGLNAVIGYVTERQSESTFEALRQVAPPSALVRRQERVQAVRAKDVVVGDILVLCPGSYVTADARLLARPRCWKCARRGPKMGRFYRCVKRRVWTSTLRTNRWPGEPCACWEWRIGNATSATPQAKRNSSGSVSWVWPIPCDPG
jgi:Ca2+-transporting ATPase